MDNLKASKALTDALAPDYDRAQPGTAYQQQAHKLPRDFNQHSKYWALLGKYTCIAITHICPQGGQTRRAKPSTKNTHTKEERKKIASLIWKCFQQLCPVSPNSRQQVASREGLLEDTLQHIHSSTIRVQTITV